MENIYGFRIKPIPDETFFGLLVTTGILAGFETYRQLYSAILGNNKLCPSTLLPRGLQKISGFLPQRYTENAESICIEHSALPYFQHFSKPKGLQKAKETMLSGIGVNVRNAVGLTSTPIKESRHLKYCRACADEQWNLHRRATWLRSHQLPGVEVCYRHGLSLCDSPISTVKYGIHSDQIQLPPQSGNTSPPNEIWSVGDAWDQTSPNRLIAQISHELLIKGPVIFDPRARGHAYRSAFISAGFRNGRYVDWAKVEVALREKYGDLIPRKIGVDFFCKSYGHWVHRITANQDCVFHPLQHILIIGAMFDNLEQLDEAMKKEAGQYVAQHAMLPTLPVQPTNSSFSTEGASSTQHESNIIDQQTLESRRHAIIMELSRNPQSTRANLKSKLGRCYQWLLINDHEWMQSILPPKVLKGKKRSSQPTTDWESLDGKLALEILNITRDDAVNIFDGNSIINRAQIARLSELSYFRVKKLITFPKTKAALNYIRGLYSGYAAR